MDRTRFSLRLGCFAMLLAAAPSGRAANLTELSPDHRFVIANSIGRDGAGLKIREMRSSADGIWFLLEPAGPVADRLIVRATPSGDTRIVASIPSDARPIGFTGTARGVATVLVTRTQRTLTEYSAPGQQTEVAAVGCSLTDGLLTIEGQAATICPDGRITRYEGGAQKNHPSWAKPGAISQVLADGRLAVVDRATGGILFNNMKTGEAFLVKPATPEIATAIKQIEAAKSAAMAVRKTGDAPLGTPLLVMDAVSDASGLYLLVLPYHSAAGPAVIHVDAIGGVLSRFRCSVDGDPVIHKLAVGHGYLFLSSVRGTVYRYKLPGKED